MRKYKINTNIDMEGILHGIVTVYTGDTEDNMQEVGGIEAYKTIDSFRTTPRFGEAYQPASINNIDRQIIDTMMDEITNGTISGEEYIKIVE
jgi:hypothetical protein